MEIYSNIFLESNIIARIDRWCHLFPSYLSSKPDVLNKSLWIYVEFSQVSYRWHTLYFSNFPRVQNMLNELKYDESAVSNLAQIKSPTFKQIHLNNTILWLCNISNTYNRAFRINARSRAFSQQFIVALFVDSRLATWKCSREVSSIYRNTRIKLGSGIFSIKQLFI